MTDHRHEPTPEGDPSLERMLFFSDGVFAIAITLLSIELHVPHGWDGTLAGLVRESWAMLGAFAISFAVIGVLWNAHRRCFLKMTRFTSGVFVLNLLVLAGIALMPFVTQLLYVRGPNGEPVFIYLGLVWAIGIAQGLAYGYAAFIADAIRPKQHAMMRASAFLMQATMPGLCSSLALLGMGGAPVHWMLIVGAGLAFVILFRIFVAKRFGAAVPA